MTANGGRRTGEAAAGGGRAHLGHPCTGSGCGAVPGFAPEDEILRLSGGSALKRTPWGVGFSRLALLAGEFHSPDRSSV
jgi:hypothetical protein